MLAIHSKAFVATNKVAATDSGVTAGTITEWMKDPIFREKIQDTQRDLLTIAQDKFRSYAMIAVETTANIMINSNNDKLKLNAAKFFLDTI